jgi:hypothetical protein
MIELLKLARESIKSKLENKELKISDLIKKKYSEKKACFVTLTTNGNLRGCIGSLEPRQELWKEVAENARNAAFSDPRFNALTKEELEKVKIEISVLSIPKKIEYKDSEDLKKKIKGKGVIIKKGYNSATYLPQVWKELPDEEEFLSSLCRKAGLAEDMWKTGKLEVWNYLVDSVEE